MPTAYLKKLAKLNHTTVNKLEKFWSQAKEIAKSEGQGKQWGLITTIFQNKLKREGYKIKACYMKKIYESTASKKETYTNDGVKYEFEKLTLAEAIKTIKDSLYDFFSTKDEPEKFLSWYDVDRNEATFQDLVQSDDMTLYIEYTNGKTWYSVGDDDKLKDLKLTGIKNMIFEFPAYTAYYGKDCKIEKFDEEDESSAYVVKTAVTASSKNTMKKVIAFNENRLDSSTKALYETMNEGSFKYNYRTDDNFSNFVKTTLSDEVIDTIRSNKSLIKKCVEKRSKTYSIVWDALTWIFLYVIKANSLRVSLSSDKIKNWFKFNNTTFDVALKPVIEAVDGLREELRETEK